MSGDLLSKSFIAHRCQAVLARRLVIYGEYHKRTDRLYSLPKYNSIMMNIVKPARSFQSVPETIYSPMELLLCVHWFFGFKPCHYASQIMSKKSNYPIASDFISSAIASVILSKFLLPEAFPPPTFRSPRPGSHGLSLAQLRQLSAILQFPSVIAPRVIQGPSSLIPCSCFASIGPLELPISFWCQQ